MSIGFSAIPVIAPESLLKGISAIASYIHQGLDLDTILEQTLNHIRGCLQTDRVLIYRFLSEDDAVILAESVGASFQPITRQLIYDPCLGADWVAQYQQGTVTVVEDVQASNLSPCYVNLLTQCGVRAKLTIPILTADRHLLGLLIVHHCRSPRPWQPLELHFLRCAADQLCVPLAQYAGGMGASDMDAPTVTPLAKPWLDADELNSDETLLLAIASDAILRLDANLTIQQVNALAVEVLGYAETDLLGWSIEEFLYPDSCAWLRNQCQHWQHKTPIQQSLIFCKADGKPLQRTATLQSRWDRKGRWNGLWLVMTKHSDFPLKLEDSLDLRHQELQTLHRFSEMTLSSRSLRDLLAEIVEELSKASHFPIVAIELYDEMRQVMVFAGSKGLPQANGETLLEIPVDETLSGTVAKTGQAIFKIFQENEAKPCDQNTALSQLEIQTFVCLPMIVNQRVLGVLSLAHPECLPLDTPLRQWFSSITNYLAALINRKQIEEGFRSVLEGTVARTGEGFFRSLVKALAKAIQVRFAFISEMRHAETGDARILAIWMGNEFGEEFDYNIHGTPCEFVLNEGLVCFPSSLQQHFPEDKWLQDVGVESYLAIPLHDQSGQPIGHLGIMHDRPIQAVFPIESILKIFAARAGAELERKKTEESLRESESRFRTMADSAPVLLRMSDRDHRCIFFNQQWMTFTGQACGLNQLHCWAEGLHPGDRPFIWERYLNALEQHQEFLLEYRMRRHDGEYRWLLDQGVPRFLPDGTFAGYINSCVDISDRKAAEATLLTVQSRLQMLLAASPAVIYALDPQFPYALRFISENVLTVIGYNPVDVMVPGWFQHRLHPDDLSSILAHLETWLASGAPHLCTFQYRFQHANGSWIWLDDQIIAVRNEAGHIVELVGAVTDVTMQVESEHRLEQISHHVPGVLYQYRLRPDGTSHFPYASRGIRDIYGVSPEDVQQDASSVFEVLHPDDLERIQQSIWDSAQQLTEWRCEYRVNLHGRMIWVEGRATPQQEPDGSVLWHGYITNVTQRKRVETTLQQQAERDRLLGAIAQHIRQSLDLETILNTTVTEVRQWLQTDRVVIYRFEADWSGTIVTESVEPGWKSLLGRQISDSCCVDQHGYVHRFSAIENVATADITSCHLNLLAELQVQANLVIPILQGQHLWGWLVAHHCSAPRRWYSFEVEFLQQLATQVAIAIQQSQLYQQTQRQAQNEQALNRVIQDIRSSLNLSTIFSTAVREIGSLLQAEWSAIWQYQPTHQRWVAVANHHHANNPPLNSQVELLDYADELILALEHEDTLRFGDRPTLPNSILHKLTETIAGHGVLIPICMGSNKVWGCLMLARSPMQPWQEAEMQLTATIAGQLAIAIHQSELHHQVQQLNTNLERQVKVRTAQLELAFEFEATLKRITDKVRDSLDEAQIMQTVVRELAIAIKVSCCNATQYNMEERTSTVCYEYSTLPISYQGRMIRMDNYPEIYSQLLQGEAFQFCSVFPNPDRGEVMMLAYPIADDQGVLGDLWLINQKYYAFNEQDIRLVQQVANQCAIALRQSRLYQAAQAQVQELERLNQLKDDFLSTVSHELRTPMSSIQMTTQILEMVLRKHQILPPEFDETEPPTPNQREISRYFNILKDECDREIALINDLLDLARLDANRAMLEWSCVDLPLWLTHITEAFIERANRQQQNLVLNLSDSLPPLTTDLSYLQRIITELLNNACKYTPPGEQICVAAHYFDDGGLPGEAIPMMEEQDLPPYAHNPVVEICITNFGIEIPAEERDRVFERFYRIPNGDPWKHGGTGLGLALVQKLVSLLNGSIVLESGDQQTTFKLRFPCFHDSASLHYEGLGRY
jgi:PAS domain S-box-containing protein